MSSWSMGQVTIPAAISRASSGLLASREDQADTCDRDPCPPRGRRRANLVVVHDCGPFGLWSVPGAPAAPVGGDLWLLPDESPEGAHPPKVPLLALSALPDPNLSSSGSHGRTHDFARTGPFITAALLPATMAGYQGGTADEAALPLAQALHYPTPDRQGMEELQSTADAPVEPACGTPLAMAAG